jgi:dihydrodipicolinate synthase/N-acetylneuraminate lyase
MADLSRSELVAEFFPAGVPRLWCPLLTHYDGDGRIDHDRVRAHIRHLAPTVRTFLAPGSTGDGWEMTDAERDELLELLLSVAVEQDLWILVGVLKTAEGEARRSIETMGAELAAGDEMTAAFARRRVCGFTVTPPKGADLEQDRIHAELDAILALGYPTALYQLPQITGNEMTPATVAELASRYPNFYLFKDTSGGDRVAHSDSSTADVFMVRGAEGDYASHLKGAGGSYDGFLLSTANSFPRELGEIVDLSVAGRAEEAGALASRVETVVYGVFDEVSALPFGNPFANANKAIDHVRAYAPDHERVPPPMTHSGERLPTAAAELAARLLREQGLLPERGYLAG